MTALEIRWLSVFADVPADRFAAARAFWESVTDTTAGAPEGEQGEFTPLEPRDGGHRSGTAGAASRTSCVWTSRRTGSMPNSPSGPR